MLSASELVAELKMLHGLALRLQPPLSQRPQIFHEQKYALVEATARLIEKMGGGSPAAFRTAPSRDTGIAAVVRRGSAIRIERRRVGENKQT